MCGRFTLTHDRSRLEDWAQAAFMPDYDLHYNIAPGSTIVAIRSTGDDTRSRTGSVMRWGLIPAWVKDPASMPMLHNARVETVAEKPMFRQALRRRRCLIPASGFYEWKAVPGQKLKQPFYISLKDGDPMAFAGLWESAQPADGTATDTCTIITTDANPVLAPIHHRMPLVLDRSEWDAWLDTETDASKLRSRLDKPPAADKMQAWGLAHAVNKVANDNPALLLPIA
jgi:putative SOS response-associated peptidase YedK